MERKKDLGVGVEKLPIEEIPLLGVGVETVMKAQKMTVDHQQAMTVNHHPRKSPGGEEETEKNHQGTESKERTAGREEDHQEMIKTPGDVGEMIASSEMNVMTVSDEMTGMIVSEGMTGMTASGGTNVMTGLEEMSVMIGLDEMTVEAGDVMIEVHLKEKRGRWTGDVEVMIGATTEGPHPEMTGAVENVMIVVLPENEMTGVVALLGMTDHLEMTEIGREVVASRMDGDVVEMTDVVMIVVVMTVTGVAVKHHLRTSGADKPPEMKDLGGEVRNIYDYSEKK